MLFAAFENSSSIITTSVATTTSYPSTITSTPISGRATGWIANNTCYTYNSTESHTVWNSGGACSVYAGTVDLVYWPTNNNYSYPATWTDTQYNYTL